MGDQLKGRDQPALGAETEGAGVQISLIQTLIRCNNLSGNIMQEVNATNQPTSNRNLWSFLVLTFLWSWSFWFASGVFSRRGAGAYDFHWLFAQIGVFGPSLVALIISGITRKDLRNNTLRILPVVMLPLIIPGILTAASAPVGVANLSSPLSIATMVVSIVVVLFFWPSVCRISSPGTGERYNRPTTKWIILSLIFFPGLFLLAWLMVNFQAGDWTSATFLAHTDGLAWLLPVAFAHNLLLGGSLGEEIGWRGLLLPALLKRNNPLMASLIFGVLWGLWHLPVDLYNGFVLEGVGAVLVRIIYALPIAILFTWFYLHSRGSLLVAMFLHTSINFLPDLGFSHFETSMVVFFILMVIAALIVSVSSREFRNGSH